LFSVAVLTPAINYRELECAGATVLFANRPQSFPIKVNAR
jgi:hypothetical protein